MSRSERAACREVVVGLEQVSVDLQRPTMYVVLVRVLLSSFSSISTRTVPRIGGRPVLSLITVACNPLIITFSYERCFVETHRRPSVGEI